MNVGKPPSLVLYFTQAQFFCGYQCYKISDPFVPIYVKHVGVICQLSLNAPSHIYY